MICTCNLAVAAGHSMPNISKMSHNAYFVLYSIFIGSSVFLDFDPTIAVIIKENKILHSLQPALQLVRCTHQSMPIVMTLSPELRVPVPTVGAIH